MLTPPEKQKRVLFSRQRQMAKIDYLEQSFIFCLPVRLRRAGLCLPAQLLGTK